MTPSGPRENVLSHIRDSNQPYIGKELFDVKCGAGHIMNVSF